MTLDLTTLTEDEAVTYAHQLLDQLAATRTEVEASERRAAGIRKMIDVMVEMFPAIEDVLPEDLDADSPRPRGASAVQKVLDDEPGSWFAVKAIVARLGQSGWLPDSSNPANAVRTAAERLVERDAIKKSKSTEGAVIYKSKKPPPPKYDPAEEPF